MEDKSKKLILILALLGIGVSAYLTYVKLNINTISCNFGDCVAVQSSKYSEILGIPVSILGLLYYFGILFFLFKFKKLLSVWGLFGILFSSYLTIVELYILRAICSWCVISFVIIILINLLIPKTAHDIPSS